MQFLCKKKPESNLFFLNENLKFEIANRLQTIQKPKNIDYISINLSVLSVSYLFIPGTPGKTQLPRKIKHPQKAPCWSSMNPEMQRARGVKCERKTSPEYNPCVNFSFSFSIAHRAFLESIWWILGKVYVSFKICKFGSGSWPITDPIPLPASSPAENQRI